MRKILRTKVLKLSNVNEKISSLWFSKNPNWEVTATKMVQDELGNRKRLTFEEQLHLLGCARIVMKFDVQFTSWDNYKKLSGIPKRELIAMESMGTPSDWYCRKKDIPQANWYTVEIFDGEHWVPYNKEHPLITKVYSAE